MENKSAITSDEKFLMPTSLIGRSVFFLFTMPFLSIALMWIWHASRSIFKRTAALFSANASLPIEEKNIDDYTAIISQYFTTYLPAEIHMFMMVYFDVVLTLGALALFFYVALRYTRNKTFGAKEYFTAFAFAIGVYSFISVFTNLYFNIYPPKGFESDWLEFSVLLFRRLVTFAVCFGYLYILFKKFPFAQEPIWKNEIPAREFFKHNMGVIIFKLRSRWNIKIFILILLFILCDFLVGG